MAVTAPNGIDVVFAALSDPTRRSIVRRLADGEATMCELAEPIPISLPRSPGSRAAVFAAWTDPDTVCRWFGPDGFTGTVREMDVRPGGRAPFDMTSGDGTVRTNRFDDLEIVPDERLVMDHGTDVDDDPNRFRVTVTLDEQADGKTLLTLRQLHPTRSGGPRSSASAPSSSVCRRCRSSPHLEAA